MPTTSVNVAVIEDGRILLIERADFQVWALPGGGVDPGESVAAAAIREVEEETGLLVHLTRLVGIYSVPLRDDHIVLFTAQRIGGELRPFPEETLRAEFFDVNALPANLIQWHRRRITDALAGVTGVAWLQHLDWPFPEEREVGGDQSGG
jgi:ADP-ribose pyrophosphatase YjhB (NUDIX family)